MCVVEGNELRRSVNKKGEIFCCRDLKTLKKKENETKQVTFPLYRVLKYVSVAHCKKIK